MSHRRGVIVAGAIAFALLLTGCTPSAPPAHTDAPVASVAPKPAPVYPTCAAMASPSTIAAIDPQLTSSPSQGYDIAPPADGAAPSARAEFLTLVYPPSATTVLAALQTGYFTCTWHSTENYVGVSVLPAATTAFGSYTASTRYDIATFDGLDEGDLSVGGCKNGDGQSCEIDTLAGSTWISASVVPPSVTAATAPAIRANLESIIRSSLAAVNAAGPIVAAQQQPSSRWQSQTDCSLVERAVESITGAAAQPQEKQPLDMTDAYNPVFRAAVAQSGGFGCADTEAAVTIVPGADVTAPVVYSADATAPVPVAVAGVTGARDLCAASDATACWSEGYIDHALVAIAGDLTPAGRHAQLAAIATALAG